MIDNHLFCPICEQQIPGERRLGGSIICTCGWTQSTAQNTDVAVQTKKTVKVYGGISGALLVLFLISANWDNNSAAMIGLKSKQIVGVASEAELKQIVDVCTEREDSECLEGAFEDLTLVAPKNLDYFQKLGSYQVKNKNYKNALKTFHAFFSNKGAGAEPAFDHALALAHTGHIDKASGYFKYALKTKSSLSHAQVARTYVSALIANKRYKAARQIILDFRRSQKNAAYFMKKELENISQKLSVAKL